MKKMLALLCSVLLLFSCSALAEAPAEEIQGAFVLTAITPDGYLAEETHWFSPYMGVIVLTPLTPDKPHITTSVAYNDSAADITFNDEMGEEAFQNYVKLIAVNPETGEEIPYTVQKTGLGTKVVILNHPTVTELYTIWHGYEVSVFAYVQTSEEPFASVAVTEDQLTVIMQYLTDLDISALISEVAE